MPSSVAKWTLRSVTSRRAKLLVPHARVEERVDDVDYQVEEDDEEGAHQDRPLHGRQVALLDGVEGEAPDAGDVEDGLGEDSPAEEDPEVEPEDGDDRRDGRAHAVLEDDGPLAQALRAGGADVVLGHRLEQVAAQEAGVDRGERRGEDAPRHDQRRDHLAGIVEDVAAGGVGALALEERELAEILGEEVER